MIIDVHNHIGLSQDGGDGSVQEIIESMKQYGIEKSILFATDEHEMGDTFENANPKILDAAEKYPDQLIAFARIIPSLGEKALAEFERCCKRGAQGLKLKAPDGFTPEDAEKLFDIIKDKKHFPVLIHTAHDRDSEPLKWEKEVAKYPTINFIFAHGGKDLYESCTKILKKYPNVYADTSTLSLNRTRYMLKHAGPEKILFASDYPYSHPGIELKKFDVLTKDKKALDLIHYKNAKKILGL